jgi:hypothetical protein
MPNFDFSGLNFDLGEYEDPLAKLLGGAAAPAPQPFETPAAAPQSFEAPAPQPFAAPFASNPNRESKLNEIDQAMSELRKVQAGQTKAASATEGMTANQLLVTAIAGILPMVMGRMAAGNAGGALGGQAGANIAQGTFQNWEKGGAERRAEAAAESKLTAEQIKDLVNRRADLEKQGFGAQDSRQAALDAAAQSDKNMNRREDFQIAQQGRSQEAQLNNLRETQRQVNERADQRNEETNNRADDIASRPYNKDIYEQQKNANKLIEQGKAIISLAQKIDPNGEEGVAEALARGVKAGIIKDSDEAQLARDQMQFVFGSLKSFFPGAISDQEREAAMKALGGDKGVPLKTVAHIMQKAIGRAVDQSNQNLDNLKGAGYKMRFSPMENPYGSPGGEQMVEIRNKRTGEVMKVPASQVGG